MTDPVVLEFLLAFWKIHILQHAEPGNPLSVAGANGASRLARSTEPKNARDARVYRITRDGSTVLNRLRVSLGELKNEVTPSTGRARSVRGRRQKHVRSIRPVASR